MNAPLLDLAEVTVGHSRDAILSSVNLTVAGGRWVALLGPNASGKTSLLHTIAGRLPPLTGAVRIRGSSLYPPRAWNGKLPALAIAPEELPPFLTVRQCYEIQADALRLGTQRMDEDELAVALQLPASADVLVRHASLGTRQKLAVVLALATRPELLLLDEIFNGLDFASTMHLRKRLRALVDGSGLGILLATHSLDVVLQCCDELVLLDRGALVRRWETREFDGPDRLASLESVLATAHAR